MLRIVLFLLTNLSVLLVASVALNVLQSLGVLPPMGSGGYQQLLIFAAVMGVSGSLISLLLSKPMAKWSTGAQVIKSPRNATEAWLLQTVTELSQRSGIGTPEVAIYASQDLNAFATGATKNSGLVAVSSGLLERLPRNEVAAVLAHEVAHIRNGDMVTLSLLQGVLNTFVIFASRVLGGIVDGFLSRGQSDRGGRGPGYFIIVMVLEVVFGVLATIVAMWFSRFREFRADAGAAQLVGPQAMAAALLSLERSQSPKQLPSNLAAFGIHGGGIARLFSSHPPIAERVRALRETAVGRVR